MPLEQQTSIDEWRVISCPTHILLMQSEQPVAAGMAAAAWHPADLAAEVLNALLDRSGIDPAAIGDIVVLGCVTQAGEQSFAFARNAVLASRLPSSVPAVTVDRQCGSSQQAIQFAAQAVMSGTQDVVIAAGAESMTRVPMFSNMTLHQKAGMGQGHGATESKLALESRSSANSRAQRWSQKNMVWPALILTSSP